MSRENVVRRALEAFEQGGVDAILPFNDADVTWQEAADEPEGEAYCERSPTRVSETFLARRHVLAWKTKAEPTGDGERRRGTALVAPSLGWSRPGRSSATGFSERASPSRLCAGAS